MSDAANAIDQLPSDEDQLFAELGKRLMAISRSPAGSDQYGMLADRPIEAYGPLDELKDLGRKFFNRWNRATFDLICGSSADDAAARQQVASAFNLGPEAVAAAVATVLVTSFGMAAALAAVVGTLSVRLFFRPGYQAMCDYWETKL